MREASADGAAVGLHHAEGKAAAAEKPLVGLDHPLVSDLRSRLVAVEAVAVLHGELAAADHAEARADLIAELGLYLVEIQRKIAVAPHLVADDVGDHFLVGGAEAEFAVVTILEADQFLAVEVPPAGLHPELRRVERREKHLLRAGAVHLLAAKLLDFPLDAEAEGKEAVHPGGKLADHARPHHELVADHLRFSRRLPEGGEKCPGKSHSSSFAGEGAAPRSCW